MSNFDNPLHRDACSRASRVRSGAVTRRDGRRLSRATPGLWKSSSAVHAVAANYVDLLVIGGKYQFLPERPFVPGKGPAGVVTAVGESVSRVRVGDRILAMAEQGGYAKPRSRPSRTAIACRPR